MTTLKSTTSSAEEENVQCLKDVGFAANYVIMSHTDIISSDDCRDMCADDIVCYIWLHVRSFCLIYSDTVKSLTPTPLQGALMCTSARALEGKVSALRRDLSATNSI